MEVKGTYIMRLHNLDEEIQMNFLSKHIDENLTTHLLGYEVGEPKENAQWYELNEVEISNEDLEKLTSI